MAIVSTRGQSSDRSWPAPRFETARANFNLFHVSQTFGGPICNHRPEDNIVSKSARASQGRSGKVRPKEGLSFAAAAVCVIVVAINLRPGIVSMGPLLPALRDEFGLSYGVASLTIAVPDFLMGALALPTPWLAWRYGRDRVILAALVLLFAVTAVRAFAPSTLVLLLTTAGVGAGIAVAGALIGAFVKANFPNKTAFMMSLYATALSLGSTVSAAATAPIATFGGGWRVAAGVWSLLGLFAIAAWLFIERRASLTSADISRRPYAFPIRNSKAWLVAFFFALDNFLFYALLSSIAQIYREQGYSASGAGFLLATFTGGVMVGSLGLGAISRSSDRRRLLAISAALCVVGTLLISFAPGVSPFFPIVVLALGVGGGFALGMTLPLDNTEDSEEAGVWNAFTFTIGYLIAAAGPVAVGVLRDATGNFHASIWLLFGASAAMLALTPLLRPKIVRAT